MCGVVGLVGKLIGRADAAPILTHTEALLFGPLAAPYRSSVESVRGTL